MLQVLFGHNDVLFHREATIFEEIAEDTLEVYDDDWVIELVRTPFKKVTVCPLEELISLRIQLHLNIFLLYLN